MMHEEFENKRKMYSKVKIVDNPIENQNCSKSQLVPSNKCRYKLFVMYK